MSLSALMYGGVRSASPFQTGIQTTAVCVWTEHNGLLGLLQSLNWAKLCQVATAVFLPLVPVSSEPLLKESLHLTVDESLQILAAYLYRSVCCSSPCQTPQVGTYWRDTCIGAVSLAKD